MNTEVQIFNKLDESIVVYRSEDNQVQLEVKVTGETVWLTQKQMAWLFDTTPQNITIHIGNVYKEKELTQETTCKDFLQVQIEGGREKQTVIVAVMLCLITFGGGGQMWG